MIFRPAQLGMAKLDRLELEQDKKACRKIGPCGVGKKALYLNSFYIDRRYYLPSPVHNLPLPDVQSRCVGK